MIRGFQGGKTAWARDFNNGTMLVVNPEGSSHVLSPKIPARILFVAPDSSILYDSTNQRRLQGRGPELITVRLTINVTFDLNGEDPEVARTLLMRMIDSAIKVGPPAHETDAAITSHEFESISVLAADLQSTTETDFSQLLEL